MSGVLSTSKWLKFFRDAGLPPDVSANYAVLFTDNRITTDMLLDLTKEYLYDMGIKVMGDVISILRYARTAYTKDAQEKIFQDNMTPSQKSTPASRMLKHYSRQSAHKTRTEWPELKRKENFETPMKKFARPSSEATTVSQVRGQCDSSEIKTNTPQFQQTVQAGKRSVFHRLGENSVSSSTDSTKAKVLGHSVFQRLGGSTSGSLSSQPASSTVSDEEVGSSLKSMYNMGPPLQYRGILKTVSRVKQPITFTSSTATESRPNITEWIKPSLLQRNVPVVTQQTLTKRVITKKPRLISTSSDPSLLFRRSLQEAKAQRQLDEMTLYGGPKVFSSTNVKTRLGSPEKTLTVHLPKSFSMVSRGQKILMNKTLASQTMISDKNAEIQRRNRIALAKKASNRIIYLNKSQAKSNVFSRLGS